MSRIRLVLWVALRLLLLLAILGLLLWLGIYGWQRNSDGKAYLTSLHPRAVSLKAACNSLSQSSEKHLYGDLPTTHADVVTKMATLRARITDVRDKLVPFDSAVSSYKAGPYIPFAEDAQKAAVAHGRAADASLQIKDVLAEYERLLTFLEAYYEANIQFTNTLTSFNKLTDLNILSGSVNNLQATAADIDKEVTQLKPLIVPPSLETVRTQAIAARERAANGFRSLAAGLSPPVDALIYGAAQEIELATSDNEATNTLLGQKIDKLPVATAVSELSEKVRSFEP